MQGVCSHIHSKESTSLVSSMINKEQNSPFSDSTTRGPHAFNQNLFTFSGSLLALGALFGSLSAVYLMDAVGRKASLLAFSVMSLFIGWTLLMAASQVWQLYTGRFLLGLGAGMEITICPVYIHEICRPALRDVCGSFPQVSSTVMAKNGETVTVETLFCFDVLHFLTPQSLGKNKLLNFHT